MRYLLVPTFALLGVLLVSLAPLSALEDDAKVIVVDLEVTTPSDAKDCFSEKFDKKRVEIPIEIDHPLNTLDDYALAEDALEGPDCFMPEMKIIFHKYTYVFSLYCTSVMKYKNSAPYKTSSTKVKSDIKMTESVLEHLESFRKKHFGSKFNPEIAKRFVKTTKLEDLDIKVDDSALYKDDDDAEDKDLEKDAIDKEGWFDETKDPELEKDETPDVGDNDGN